MPFFDFPLKNTDGCYYPFITSFQDQPESDARFVTLRILLRMQVGKRM